MLNKNGLFFLFERRRWCRSSSFKPVRVLGNSQGMAAIEMIPMLIITILFFGFSLGFFGIIQSGILNSVGARNYAFESFMHRSHLVYFKIDPNTRYNRVGSRVHGIRSEKSRNLDWNATARPLLPFGTIAQIEEQSDLRVHRDKVFQVQDGRRYTDEGVSSVWIQTVYGICLRSSCEPN